MPAHAFQGQADRLIFRPTLEPRAGNRRKALEQQASAPLHRRHFQRPVSTAELTAEQGRRRHSILVEVVPAQCPGEGNATQRMADPVGRLRVLLMDEVGNRRQIVAHVVADAVVPVPLVARRQPMPAHFGDPHIEAGTRQVRAQTEPLGRIPEASIGETAVQQDHRHAAPAPISRHAQTGQGQLDRGIRAVAGLEAIDILAQVETKFRADQGDGEKLAAALHLLRSGTKNCREQFFTPLATARRLVARDGRPQKRQERSCAQAPEG
ncbi:hypothetical protein D3C86_1528990 [compost metagenome]